MAYAETTTVSVEKSISEIVALIKKAGAARIAQVDEPGSFAMQFFLNERMLRFRVQFPSIDDVPKLDHRGYLLSADQRSKKVLQRQRQRARALLLVIKAKLESVESGVETFEEAFLPNIVLPGGETVGDFMLPQVERAYIEGTPPSLLALPAPSQ